MGQTIASAKGATSPALMPRKGGVTPLRLFFSFLLFVPRCAYTATRCIDTVLEEGLLHLRCIHQGCTTQGALQVMFPLLHEHDVRRLTLETGVVGKHREAFQLTVGGSFRHAFSADGFWGVNGVLDASDKESGTQMSVGVEGYLSSFFTSLSYYLPLGTIQEKEAVQPPPKKQLAKSIEVRLFYTFSSVESVRAGIVVEQLMGKAIALPGTEEKQQNPRRGSFQIEYQPTPLVNFHLGYQLQSGSSRCHQVVAGLELTFWFNQPLVEQTKRSIQKKVLLTGNGAYELLARRYDRVIDHGTMPEAATPVVVAMTPGPVKPTATGTSVTGPAGKNTPRVNGGDGANSYNGQTTYGGNSVDERPKANQAQRGVEHELFTVGNIGQQKKPRSQNQVWDVAKASSPLSYVPTNVEVRGAYSRHLYDEIGSSYSDTADKLSKQAKEKKRNILKNMRKEIDLTFSKRN